MNYWKKHFNENVNKYRESLKRQVDMTLNGKEVDDKQITLRLNSIEKNLSLNSSDKLLDLCCGNGMLTKLVSSKVKFINAIDFSAKLIETAKKYNYDSNIIYEIDDITKIDLRKYNVNKINIYSCIQYLSKDELNNLLFNLSFIKNSLIYISNIPDKLKLFDYYNTEQKKDFYETSLRENKPHIGNWYTKDEFIEIAFKNNLNCKIVDIDKRINTSYYRFDAILIPKI